MVLIYSMHYFLMFHLKNLYNMILIFQMKYLDHMKKE